jgi:hypothetical protein
MIKNYNLKMLYKQFSSIPLFWLEECSENYSKIFTNDKAYFLMAFGCGIVIAALVLYYLKVILSEVVDLKHYSSSRRFLYFNGYLL